MYIIASMHGQTWASCKQIPAISGKNNVHSQRQQHGAPQLAVAWVFGGLCSFPSTELLTNTSGPVREPGKTRKQIRTHREKTGLRHLEFEWICNLCRDGSVFQGGTVSSASALCYLLMSSQGIRWMESKIRMMSAMNHVTRKTWKQTKQLCKANPGLKRIAIQNLG